MRVALYTRVSTQRQAQEGTSLDYQRQHLEEYAQQKGGSIEPHHIFCDDGYSGANLTRPGLDKLRDRAVYGEFELVLITEPDRLARKFVHQVLLIEELENCGCQVEFIDRPLSQDPQDQLMLQIRGAVAEYERTLIVERTRRGRRAKLETGELLPWVRTPFGYRTDPERPRSPAGVKTDPFEAEIVRNIFSWYLEEGLTLYKIAKRLSEQKIPTTTGKSRWSPGTLRGMLRNPVYMGKACANRYQVVESQRRRLGLKPAQRRYSHIIRPKEEWIEIVVPPIVSEEIFEMVQQKMSKNKANASRNNHAHNYLLRRMVNCGHCSMAMNAIGGQKAHNYYVCPARVGWRSLNREDPCKSPYIRSDELDALVWKDLCRVVRDPEMVRAALERASNGLWLPEELRRRQRQIKRALGELERQSERLLNAYLAGAWELEQLKHKKMEMAKRKEVLESQHKELEGAIRRELEVSQLAASIEEFMTSIKEGLEHADFSQRRELIELLIDRVVVKDDEVEIRYVVPIEPNGPHYPFYHLRLDYLGVRLDTSLILSFWTPKYFLYFPILTPSLRSGEGARGRGSGAFSYPELTYNKAVHRKTSDST